LAVSPEVQPVARALDGALLAERRVVHIDAFRDDNVARTDVEEFASTDCRPSGRNLHRTLDGLRAARSATANASSRSVLTQTA